VRDLRHILPLDYQPVCFASNNNAFHLALLAWRYDTTLSQPGAALEYLETHLHKRCMPGYTPTYWKAQTRHHSSDIDYIYKLALKIDDQVERRQYAMSLLWHNVWLLQYSPSSTKPTLGMIIGISIAYWMRKLYKIHVGDERFATVILDEIHHQHVRLCQLDAWHRHIVRRSRLRQIDTMIDAMLRQKVRRSSPLPTIPSPQERGAESKSMSVVPTSSTKPHTLSSHLHPTRARMGAVTTQSVSVKHTDKMPPPDASRRRYEKSSSSPPPPISSTQDRGAETKSMTVVSASSSSAAPLALSSHIHSTQARTGAVPTQSVSMPHTAKQPPEDASPRRREKSSYPPSQSTQKRGGRIQAKTSHSIYEVDKAVHIQRLWRSLQQRIRVRISRRIQQIRVLHAVLVLQHCIRGLLLRKQYERRSHTKQLLRQTSKHTQQVKAKQTQSNRGGNRRPPPIPLETSIGSNDSDRKFLQHPFRHRGMQPTKWKKTRRGKRKTPRCRTGRRHTPNAPDPTLDRGGVPWCISDTTEESIKFTDFDTESTEPSCMPLVYWSTQTTAAINLLRPEQPTTTVYLPYVSTANAAATIIQHAYTKYINHVMPHHHHHVTTNAPIQLNDIYTIIERAVERAFNNNIIQHAVERAIMGDNQLLEDNG